jgi:hypothetical protein
MVTSTQRAPSTARGLSAFSANDGAGVLLPPRGDAKRTTPAFPGRHAAVAVIAALVFGFALAVLALAARLLPGETPSGSLTVHAAPACAGCPAEERITGAGLLEAGGHRYVTVRFAAPPVHASLALTFEGVDGTLHLSKEHGSWTASFDGNEGVVEQLLIGTQENRVVVSLPESIPARGGAAATPSDRLPASGFVPLHHSPKPQISLFDAGMVILIALLALLAWRRGLTGAVPAFISGATAIALLRLLYPVFAALFERIDGSGGVQWPLLLALLIAATGFTSYVAARLLAPPVLRRCRRFCQSRRGRLLDRTAAVPLALFSSLSWLAMLLSLIVGLVFLGAAGAAIDTSLTGHALISAWTHFFPPL